MPRTGTALTGSRQSPGERAPPLRPVPQKREPRHGEPGQRHRARTAAQRDSRRVSITQSIGSTARRFNPLEENVPAQRGATAWPHRGGGVSRCPARTVTSTVARHRQGAAHTRHAQRVVFTKAARPSRSLRWLVARGLGGCSNSPSIRSMVVTSRANTCSSVSANCRATTRSR